MFKHTPCGETIPPNNIHAVSVSIPTIADLIAYEEGISKDIKSGYPRFVLHPYLRKMADFLHLEYGLSQKQEIVLVSSQMFANIIAEKYSLNNDVDFCEEFGVVAVLRGSDELKSVLRFIQHVGCNLSSRFAELYLYKKGLIDSLHVEELEEPNSAESLILKTLCSAYEKDDICLSVSGMNAMYSILKGIQEIKKGLVIQLGWIYLDSMNLIESYDSKVFYNALDLDLVEKFISSCEKHISCIVTEVPTNPLLQCVDLKRLKRICLKYDITLVIDSTFATAFTPIKEADILVESLTKFACGNADVLMGCFVLSREYAKHKDKFLAHLDSPFIGDIRRLACEITSYEKRVKIANKNRELLVEFLKKKSFIKRVYHSPLSAVISIEFAIPFVEAYDNLDFFKGPSLGTKFTLLMPYVYLAHYDLIISDEGKELLRKNKIPIDLLRVSVGTEDIDNIKLEFKKLDLR